MQNNSARLLFVKLGFMGDAGMPPVTLRAAQASKLFEKKLGKNLQKEKVALIDGSTYKIIMI